MDSKFTFVLDDSNSLSGLFPSISLDTTSKAKLFEE
jgi:hypothetical protein